jgi:hypothetical protein
MLINLAFGADTIVPLAAAVSPSHARIKHKVRTVLNYYMKLLPSTNGLKKRVVVLLPLIHTVGYSSLITDIRCIPLSLKTK